MPTLKRQAEPEWRTSPPSAPRRRKRELLARHPDTAGSPDNKIIRLVLVESSVLAGVGARAILDLEPDIEIVAECRSPAEAIPVVAETRPDVVLVDVRLDEPSVAAATRRLTHGARGSAIVVVGGADDGLSILEAIAVGAAAHVAEVAEPGELVALIRRVADGKDPLKESLISRPDLVEQMVDAVRDGFIGPDGRSSMSVTPRELDVLRHLASGLRNREIANRLGVSEQTVKNHLSRVLHKLGVSNRMQAVTYAVRQGWLLLDPVAAGSAEPMRSRAHAEDNS
jgi:DNA-binding NarL/FixJ family response regulator